MNKLTVLIELENILVNQEALNKKQMSKVSMKRVRALFTKNKLLIEVNTMTKFNNKEKSLRSRQGCEGGPQ